MAQDPIAQNPKQRNPYKICRTCGYSLLLARFDLINLFSNADSRRKDDCSVCDEYLRAKHRLEEIALNRTCPVRIAKRNEEKRKKVNARESKRRTRKLQAMPHWVDEEHILPHYLLACQRTMSTGIKHHVDHIVPLQHHLVCGLHVPWNLQVITAEENLKKSNRFIPS